MDEQESSLKYFSWKYVAVWTWIGMLGTEIFGKGYILVNINDKPIFEFFQSVYNFLTMGGEVFTVMTFICILTGIFIPYAVFRLKGNDSVVRGIVFMSAGASVAIFAGVFGTVLSIIYGNIGSIFGVITGAILGAIIGLVLSIAIVNGIRIAVTSFARIVRLVWRDD